MKSFVERYVKLIVVIAVVCGSASGIFGALINAPSMAIGFWRLTLALPVFVISVFVGRHKGLEQFKGLTIKDYSLTAMAGIFLFGHFFTWFNAVKLTNIASAVVLAALHPLVVIVLSLFILKKRTRLKSLIGIVFAIFGSVIIAGLDYQKLTQSNWKGDILAIAAAIFMGIYFFIGHVARKRIAGSIYVLLVFLFCWISFLVGCILTETKLIGYSPQDYVYIIMLTIICQLGAHAVFNLCLDKVDSLYVSTLESGEAVSAILLAFIFLQQLPTWWQLAGCVIVVGGLIYYNRSEGEIDELQG